jgi:multimeric flavodoxin WrbA
LKNRGGTCGCKIKAAIRINICGKGNFAHMRKAIILGSNRKDGETSNAIRILVEKSGWDLIDLNDYNFSYYDYEHKNAGDDYIPLMRRVLADYDALIFATPVYWYSMSGIMKVFFDRFTDLLTIEKDLGRQLRGKSMAALSCSVGNHLGDLFWLPFSETAKYLGMNYIGNLHIVIDEVDPLNIDERAIEEFVRLVEGR